VRSLETDQFPAIQMGELSALANEIERLTKCLHQANANHEEFERKWYLALGEIEDLKEQKAATESTRQQQPANPDD